MKTDPKKFNNWFKSAFNSSFCHQSLYFAFRNEPVHSTRITRYKLHSCLLSSWLHCVPVFLIFFQNLWDFFPKKGKKGVVDSEIHTGAAPHHSFLLVLQIFMHHLCTNRKKFSVKIPIYLGDSSFFFKYCLLNTFFLSQKKNTSNQTDIPLHFAAIVGHIKIWI